jgi:glycosyltransferase involved in cell wall biosynthesis
LLKRAGCPEERMKLLSAAFFDAVQVESLRRPLEFISNRPARPLRLFAGGDIEARKGYHIALGALAEARRRGVDFEYRIAGSGSHVGAIKALAGRLGIGDRVRISEALSGEEYRRTLWESDVYFLPSLRDSAGITLMEAMLAGCVPLVADCGGPGMIVDGDSGFKVGVGAEKNMVAGFADRLAEFASGAPCLLKKGESARVRIEQGFSENNYLAKVEGVYRALR